MNADERLPSGRAFARWEPRLRFSRTWRVDGGAAHASDRNPGTAARPFRTIQRAAEAARPGDCVVVAGGVYRECVRPRRGGTSRTRMISYQAAPGAEVIIRGSEIVRAPWRRSRAGRGLWTVRLKASDVRKDHPFRTPNIGPRQFDIMPWAEGLRGKTPYTLPCGLVFQDGRRLRQVETPKALRTEQGTFRVGADGRTLTVHPFGGRDPNHATMDVTARAQGFAPDVPGLGYIHVRGFTLEHMGNPFPMPQYGALSTTRGHHWVIEDNTVREANALGMDVGNQHPSLPQPKTLPGNHIVRRNRLCRCGVCGLQALGCNDTAIEQNLIVGCAFHDVEIYFETGGIKTHNNVRSLIRGNCVVDTQHGPGIWMDAANRDSRCTGNVVVGTHTMFGGLFLELSEVPNRVDRNVVWDTHGAGMYEHDCGRQQFVGNIVGRSTGAAAWLRGKVTERRLGKHPLTDGLHIVEDNTFFENTRDIETDKPQERVARNLTLGATAATAKESSVRKGVKYA